MLIKSCYCRSLGLAVAPRVRFLNKAQKQRNSDVQNSSSAVECDSDEELESFKAQLRGDKEPSTKTNQSEEDEGSKEEEEDDDKEEKQMKSGGLLSVNDEDDDEDLRDVELLTVTKKDVFNVSEDQQDEKVNTFLTSLLSVDSIKSFNMGSDIIWWSLYLEAAILILTCIMSGPLHSIIDHMRKNNLIMSF